MSGSNATMVLPANSGRFASSSAAHIAAPDVMPQRTPSFAPSARAVSPASFAETVSTSVTSDRSKMDGMKFAPMPCSWCGPATPFEIIGLALACAVKGYRLILVMPETMSVERRRLAAAYGAEVVLTPGAAGMKGCLDKAAELNRTIPGSFIPNQFDNPANAEAHERTTGPEIWADLGGRVDAFVAGVGTGGTLTGVGRFLRAKNPSVKLFAVEPDASPLLSKGVAGPHKLQGIGANFVPSILDRSLIDEVICVSAEDAMATARDLGAKEGVLCGISSGAAMRAALEVAKRPEFAGKTVVTLLPDTGERYLSTELFN